MIQSVEAIIDKQGKVSLLEPVHVHKKRRALVMILDEEPLPAEDQNESPPRPKGMGLYHSGRNDISQNAKSLLRNMIGKKK